MYLVHSLPLATATPSSTSSSLLFHPTQQQKNQTKRFEVFLQPLLPHVFFFGGGGELLSTYQIDYAIDKRDLLSARL